MTTIEISATPCEFKDGCVSIMLSMLLDKNQYRQRFEVRTVADADAALETARAAVAGKDMALIVLVKAGRKPAGFDRWYGSLRDRKYVKAQPTLRDTLVDIARTGAGGAP